MAFTPRLRITNATTAALTRIERARGFLEAARLSEDWVAEMRTRALVREAHHTTHIEGTQLTLEESDRLLAGQTVPEAQPDDVQELLNYRRAFDFVAEYLDSSDRVTEGLICEIHKHLVQGVRGDEAGPGRYRTDQNYVVDRVTGSLIYKPPPADDVRPMMAELVTWLNAEQEIHPVLVAAIAQFRLLHIHPFGDGNGRTSRLLSTLCLYRAGYDFKRLFAISEYYDRNRPAYYAAIQGVRDSGMDMTEWLEYFSVGLATQMREIQQQGQSVIRRDIVLSAASRAGLKDRPLAVLRFLVDRGKGTASECAEALQANRRTMQRDLNLLVDKGFAHRVGKTPTDPKAYFEPILQQARTTKARSSDKKT
ncbi:MAG: Fic family protein [Candidatus Eisenbacteria sp.]|nr:Fic family protein [Candidatus Eisenbacteria bacterium]